MRSQLLKITDAGRRNMLFHVPMRELYDLWAKCRKESDYPLGLLAMNHFYNFGRQISPIGSSKLLSLCIRCNQYDEAIQLLKHSNAWLQEPPSLNMIYTLMNIFFIHAEYRKVRLCFQYVRENWKLKIRPRLYDITIKSCLLMPQYPLQEALIIYNDAYQMDVFLPESTHFTLLDCTLTLYTNDKDSNDKEFYLNAMKHIKERLEVESLIYYKKLMLMPKTLKLLAEIDKILSQ